MAAIRIESVRDGGFVIYDDAVHPGLRGSPIFAGSHEAAVQWLLCWLDRAPDEGKREAEARDRAFADLMDDKPVRCSALKGQESDGPSEYLSRRYAWGPDEKIWRID